MPSNPRDPLEQVPIEEDIVTPEDYWQDHLDARAEGIPYRDPDAPAEHWSEGEVAYDAPPWERGVTAGYERGQRVPVAVVDPGRLESKAEFWGKVGDELVSRRETIPEDERLALTIPEREARYDAIDRANESPFVIDLDRMRAELVPQHLSEVPDPLGSNAEIPEGMYGDTGGRWPNRPLSITPLASEANDRMTWRAYQRKRQITQQIQSKLQGLNDTVESTTYKPLGVVLAEILDAQDPTVSPQDLMRNHPERAGEIKRILQLRDRFGLMSEAGSQDPVAMQAHINRLLRTEQEMPGTDAAVRAEARIGRLQRLAATPKMWGLGAAALGSAAAVHGVLDKLEGSVEDAYGM